MTTEAKVEKIKENMNASPVIDTSIEIRIPRSEQKFDHAKHKFKCTCCGKGFTVQRNNFQQTSDVLYQANDGYLPWCKECTDKYEYQLTALYSGNEELAIKYFCQKADWVYDIEVLKQAKKISSDRSKISHYAAKKNLNVGGRKTFIDSIKHAYELKQSEIIESKEQIKNDDISVTASAIDRWGIGFSELDYKNLDEHYRMLKRNNPNTDNNQEIFIKALCNINMLMVRSLKAGDSKEYNSLVEQYSKTFKQAGLKTIEEKDSSADECLGVTLAAISQYTPEEYYKNRSLYTDFDGLGEYFDRFVKRPLKNLMFGTNERDKEYCVKEESDLDE